MSNEEKLSPGLARAVLSHSDKTKEFTTNGGKAPSYIANGLEEPTLGVNKVAFHLVQSDKNKDLNDIAKSNEEPTFQQVLVDELAKAADRETKEQGQDRELHDNVSGKLAQEAIKEMNNQRAAQKALEQAAVVR
ncbi:MAG: hypothetical protein LBL47_02625 [Lactobacillus sp.]|jgi:hypothetical protein|nr:hypothetical protein [Lactobacillus sp.]